MVKPSYLQCKFQNQFTCKHSFEEVKTPAFSEITHIQTKQKNGSVNQRRLRTLFPSQFFYIFNINTLKMVQLTKQHGSMKKCTKKVWFVVLVFFLKSYRIKHFPRGKTILSPQKAKEAKLELMNDLLKGYYNSWVEESGTVFSVSRCNCSHLPLYTNCSIQKGHNLENFLYSYKPSMTPLSNLH